MALSRVERERGGQWRCPVWRESKEVSSTVSCGEGARSVDIVPTQKGAENCEGG